MVGEAVSERDPLGADVLAATARQPDALVELGPDLRECRDNGTPADDRGWLLRPFDPSTDDDAMYLFSVAYTRSRAGQRADAQRAGGSTTLAERMNPNRAPDPDRVAAQKAFLDAHRPIWEWLLEHATVTLAVDASKPETAWAWAITSEPNIVHAVGCKRSVIEARLSVDIVRDMLGDRLRKHQVTTLELPQMRVRGGDAIGIDRPREWSMDPTWLLTRMRPWRSP